MVTLENDILDNTLKFVEIASFGMKQAMDKVEVFEAGHKKAEAFRPEVLDLMLKTAAIKETQKKEAEAMLASHDTTLQLLKSAVEKIAMLKEASKKNALNPGQGDTEKKAGANGQGEPVFDSLTHPVVGLKTSQKKASDVAILRVLDDPRR